MIGIEADYDAAHISGSTSASTPGGTFPNGFFVPGAFSAGLTITSIGTVRGRFGWTPADNKWLFYVTGGIAYASVNNAYSAAFPGSSDLFTSSRTDWTVGGTIGGGVEWAFRPNWSLKFEYLYYTLASTRDVTTLGGRYVALVAAGTIAPFSNSFANSGSILRVGLNYHFDWVPPMAVK